MTEDKRTASTAALEEDEESPHSTLVPKQNGSDDVTSSADSPDDDENDTSASSPVEVAQHNVNNDQDDEDHHLQQELQELHKQVKTDVHDLEHLEQDFMADIERIGSSFDEANSKNVVQSTRVHRTENEDEGDVTEVTDATPSLMAYESTHHNSNHEDKHDNDDPKSERSFSSSSLFMSSSDEGSSGSDDTLGFSEIRRELENARLNEKKDPVLERAPGPLSDHSSDPRDSGELLRAPSIDRGPGSGRGGNGAASGRGFSRNLGGGSEGGRSGRGFARSLSAKFSAKFSSGKEETPVRIPRSARISGKGRGRGGMEKMKMTLNDVNNEHSAPKPRASLMKRSATERFSYKPNDEEEDDHIRPKFKRKIVRSRSMDLSTDKTMDGSSVRPAAKFARTTSNFAVAFGASREQGHYQAKVIRKSRKLDIQTGGEAYREVICQRIIDYPEAMNPADRRRKIVMRTGNEVDNAKKTSMHGMIHEPQYRLQTRMQSSAFKEQIQTQSVAVGPLTTYLIWSLQSNFILVLLSEAAAFMSWICIFAVFIYFGAILQPECLRLPDEKNFEEGGSYFQDAFTLSWTTFSTVGYGLVRPQVRPGEEDIDGAHFNCAFMTTIAAFESFFGVLFASFCGAVIVGKMTRAKSTASIRFSQRMILRFGAGIMSAMDDDDRTDDRKETPVSDQEKKRLFYDPPVLEFRLANNLFNNATGEIANARISVVGSTLAEKESDKSLLAIGGSSVTQSVEVLRGMKDSATYFLRKQVPRFSDSELTVPRIRASPRSGPNEAGISASTSDAHNGNRRASALWPSTTVTRKSLPTTPSGSNDDVPLNNVAVQNKRASILWPSTVVTRKSLPTTPSGSDDDVPLKDVAVQNKRMSILWQSAAGTRKSLPTTPSGSDDDVPLNDVAVQNKRMSILWPSTVGVRKSLPSRTPSGSDDEEVTKKDNVFQRVRNLGEHAIESVLVRKRIGRSFSANDSQKPVEKVAQKKEEPPPPSRRNAICVDEDPTGGLIPKKLFSSVKIECDTHPFLKRVWTLRHVLDADSPLLSEGAVRIIRESKGLWPAEMCHYSFIRKNVEFQQLIVSLSGMTNGTNVYGLHVYEYRNLHVGYTFAPMLSTAPDGCLEVDLDSIDTIRVQRGGGAEPIDYHAQKMNREREKKQNSHPEPSQSDPSSKFLRTVTKEMDKGIAEEPSDFHDASEL